MDALEKEKNLQTIALKRARETLLSLRSTEDVLDVSSVEKYHQRAIDFLWTYRHNGQLFQRSLKINGYHLHDDEHFFFETAGHQRIIGPTYVMYSTADYYGFYYHIERRLYLLPTEDVQQFLMRQMHQYEIYNRALVDIHRYIIVSGRSIPKKTLLHEVTHFHLFEAGDVYTSC